MSGELSALTSSLLTVIVNHFTAASVALPERRYTHVGAIARDVLGQECDGQLVVSSQGIGRGAPDAQVFAERTVTIDIELLRCVPVPDGQGNPPTNDALTASAEEINNDGQTLYEAVFGNVSDIVACDRLLFSEMVPVGPEGGIGGWRLRVEAGF